MKKSLTILLLLISVAAMQANDAAFYANGNHLIPIHESQVRVQKEVLKLKYVNGLVEVDVYYEFFNPGNAKDILVGFEAAPPYPFSSADMTNDHHHPNIFNFNVVMNGSNLSYDVAIVPLVYYEEEESNTDPFYLKDGKINALSQQQIDNMLEEENSVSDDSPFYYVYHFNAHFKKGLNTVRHTYKYKPSNSVMYSYTISYILTAANRWANKQIDDFTLEIDMGERESFAITPNFFNSEREWEIRGKCRTTTLEVYNEMGEKVNAPFFHMQKGSLRFKAKNFHPQGNLDINSPIQYFFLTSVSPNELLNDMRSRYISMNFGFEDIHQYEEWFDGQEADIVLRANALQKKILRNLPFAQRGYVFKNKDLQKYYESTDWYMPNPSYKADPAGLQKYEQIWLDIFSK